MPGLHAGNSLRIHLRLSDSAHSHFATLHKPRPGPLLDALRCSEPRMRVFRLSAVHWSRWPPSPVQDGPRIHLFVSEVLLLSQSFMVTTVVSLPVLIMMQACRLPHPPSPPRPGPLYPPPCLSSAQSSCLALLLFPVFLGGLVWSCPLLPLWGGSCGLLVGPASPEGGLYVLQKYGCSRL